MNAENILDNVNLISEKLFKSVETEVYKVLDEIVVIGPEILKSEPLKNICYTDKINGIIIIANAFILFYAIYFAIKQFINLYNGEGIGSVYKFIIRIVFTAIIVNCSYYICEEILNLFKILADTVDIFCKEISGKEATFQNLKEVILSIEDFLDNDLLSLNGLIKGVISFGSVSILINFAIRYVTIVFIVLIAPFAFISLSANITSGIFKSWCKIFIVNLLVQIIIKFIILIPIMYKDINSIMYKIILVGAIYLIYRINNFTKEIFVKISSESNITNFFKD